MTPLQRAAQQALSTLESGVLLCALTAASILRVALEAEQAQAVEPAESYFKSLDAAENKALHDLVWVDAEQAQAVEPVTWKAHIQTARNVYSDFLDVQEALNYLEQVFLAAIPAPPPAQQVAVPEMVALLEWITAYVEALPASTTEAHKWAAISRQTLKAQQVAVPAAIEEIKRYSPDMQYDWVRMEPDQHGDWVRYSDFLDAKAQQVAVPTGWALVPIEPTPAILDAMSSSGWKTACYKAMLAAAQGAKP